MPLVAEIKKFEGAIWARIEVDGDEGSVTLWTEDEKHQALKAERERCAQIADDLGALDAGHTNIRAGYAAAARAIARDIRAME